MNGQLIAPHGGTLIDLLAAPDRARELKGFAKECASWDLTPRQLFDLELLGNGGFSPLRGFMVRADYESVCSRMRLADGVLWPMPITLDVGEELAGKLNKGDALALRDPEGVMLAVLHVEEVWKPDPAAEAQAVFGTVNPEHPGVGHLLARSYPYYVGGRLELVELPIHYDYRSLRLTPAELRADFLRLGWRRIIGFQTRNPMHRAHQELTLRAARGLDANLLIQPVVGITKPGDVDHYTRVRCYQALLPHYPAGMVKLSLLPLAMRMAGPRDAVWHAIIRKNFGCTHFIVGRDHAGPGKASNGQPFYSPYDAQKLVLKYQNEIGIGVVPFRMMVYIEELGALVPEDEVPAGMRELNISGTELRRRLHEGRDIPHWFTFPAVARELERSVLPRHRQGFSVFVTGPQGSGASAVAKALRAKLLEIGGRPVTLLDEEVARKYLLWESDHCGGDCDACFRRIGFVASEIARSGGIAICTSVSPPDSACKEVGEIVNQGGGFVLVHLSAPRDVCEKLEREKARAASVKEVNGRCDSCEASDDADLVIDTGDLSVEESALWVILVLARRGHIDPQWHQSFTAHRNDCQPAP